jgi:hypothetical protein
VCKRFLELSRDELFVREFSKLYHAIIQNWGAPARAFSMREAVYIARQVCCVCASHVSQTVSVRQSVWRKNEYVCYGCECTLLRYRSLKTTDIRKQFKLAGNQLHDIKFIEVENEVIPEGTPARYYPVLEVSQRAEEVHGKKAAVKQDRKNEVLKRREEKKEKKKREAIARKEARLQLKRDKKRKLEMRIEKETVKKLKFAWPELKNKDFATVLKWKE